MADQFKVQEAVTFLQQTPPETFRLLDITITDTPVSFNHGKLVVDAATTDQLIVEDVNIFTMNCATGVSLKVGATTNPAMTNVTYYAYKGAKTTFYVSNAGTEAITISYASASI